MDKASDDFLWANPDVAGIQSRLYSPGYVSPARWVLFEPQSRRAYSALGKDIVPDAISVLAAAAGGTSRAALTARHEHVTSTHLGRLTQAGLLTTERAHQTGPRRTFVSSFHIANVNYPFFDYGSPSVAEEESKLLDHYATLWPAPPPILERDGYRHALPSVDGMQRDDTGERGLSLLTLAWILKIV